MFVLRVGMLTTLGVACFEDLGLVGWGLGLNRAEVVALKSTPTGPGCTSLQQL